jgi:hypothetical protein
MNLPPAASCDTIPKSSKIHIISPSRVAVQVDLEEGNIIDNRGCNAHDNEHDCCCQEKKGTNMVNESSQTHFDGYGMIWDGMEAVVVSSVCYSKIAGNYAVIMRKRIRLPFGSDVRSKTIRK